MLTEIIIMTFCLRAASFMPQRLLLTPMRIDAIPHTDNHVKIVEINLMGLSFAFNSAMLSGSCIFCNYHIRVKFT